MEISKKNPVLKLNPVIASFRYCKNIYYKNTLTLKVLDIHILQECINFEIKIKNKICNFIVLYRSPSQSQDTFESFIDNLELNIDAIAAKNPYLIGILGDFNAKLST